MKIMADIKLIWPGSLEHLSSPINASGYFSTVCTRRGLVGTGRFQPTSIFSYRWVVLERA